MENEFIILIALLLLSGFFSSSELAFVVANKIKIELRARKNRLAERNIQYFVNNPQTFYSTILIGNNIVNIAFASLLTLFLSRIYEFSEFSILLISSSLLLFFGELIPKYFARETADTFIKITAIPVRLFSFILFPFTRLTGLVTNIITESGSQNEELISHLFEKDDLKELVIESYEAGVVDEKESDIVNKVMELGDQKVYEVMTPRTDIIGAEINTELNILVEEFIKSGYSKFPVYEENLDNIKGVVFAKDIFKNPEDLAAITRDVIFIPDTKKSLELLNEMLAQHVTIAIIVDEFGGTAGIVTLEDIIEELFGEIQDEFDTDDEVCKKIDPHTYVISGKVEIDRVNEDFGLQVTEGDYETFGGFITSNIGRIPEKGEIIDIEHFRINILRADKRKIGLVKLSVDQEKIQESQ